MVMLLVAQMARGAGLAFAEELEAQAHYSQAGVEFYRFATYWPEDSLAPYALFRAGLCYGKAGEFSVAEKVFSEYLDRGYPKPEYARLEIAKIEMAQAKPVDTLLVALERDLPRQARRIAAWAWLTRDDPDRAAPLLSEAGDDSLASALKEFPRGPTPLAAGCLSTLLPGAGQLYYGHPGDAFMAFLFSGGFAALSYYYFAKEKRATPGWITGGLAGFFWLGQAYGAYVGARARRHKAREAYLLMFKTKLFKDIYRRDFFR